MTASTHSRKALADKGGRVIGSSGGTQMGAGDTSISGWILGLGSGDIGGHTVFQTHWHLFPQRGRGIASKLKTSRENNWEWHFSRRHIHKSVLPYIDLDQSRIRLPHPASSSR